MNMNLRNILLVGVVIVGIIVLLVLFNTLMSAIVPMAIVAVIAFILGRMSVNVNLLSLVTDRLRAKPEAEAATSKAEKTPQAATRAAERLVEQPAESKPESKEEAALDSVIKTEEQLRAESKRIEEEVSKRTAGYDPKAAIEERKKRLLGKQE